MKVELKSGPYYYEGRTPFFLSPSLSLFSRSSACKLMYTLFLFVCFSNNIYLFKFAADTGVVCDMTKKSASINFSIVTAQSQGVVWMMIDII